MALERRSTPPSSTVSTSARISFEVGGTDDLAPDAGYGGILAWYSLIHLTPGAIGPALAQVRRALRPGGSLLLGFFDGDHRTAFDHAVTTAYTWCPVTTAVEMSDAGWRVTRMEQRRDDATRPHASIAAVTGYRTRSSSRVRS